MVGAAVRKPRVPNDKLRHMTDNRLAEADGCMGQVPFLSPNEQCRDTEDIRNLVQVIDWKDSSLK